MAKRVRVNEEIRKFWRLLDPKISLDRVWFEINAHRGSAASSTVEALMYQLRKGTDALAQPDTLRRLAELDDAQMLKVAADLQQFKPEIAPAWTTDQLEVLAAVRRKLK